MTEHHDVAAELGTAAQRYVESLSELGIEIMPARGTVEVDPRGHAKIGHLVIDEDGVVRVVPRAGTTIHQQLALLEQASLARCNGPDPRAGWGLLTDTAWSCAVFQPL